MLQTQHTGENGDIKGGRARDRVRERDIQRGGGRESEKERERGIERWRGGRDHGYIVRERVRDR